MSELGILSTIASNNSSILAVIPCDNKFGLLEGEKVKFENFLDEFKDVFAQSNNDLSCAKNIKHKVDVGDSKPIY